MVDTHNKLSLVSQFDDLCRYQAIFQDGLETDFLKFVRNQEQCRIRWLQTESDLKSLQNEYEVTVQELGHWKTNFEEMRVKAQIENKRRMEVERKLNEMTKLFGEVKEVVNRDNTITDQTKERFAMWQNYEPMQPINENEFAEASVEFDNTGDLLGFDERSRELPGSKRSSYANRRSGGHNLSKRKRSSPDDVNAKTHSGASIVATTTVNVPSYGGDIVATTKLDAFRKASESIPPPPPPPPFLGPTVQMPTRRSVHEAVILVEPTAPPRYKETAPSSDSDRENLYPSKMLETLTKNILPRTPTTPNLITRTFSTNSLPFRQQNSGSKLNGRAHDFASKTVIRPEACLPCGRRIKFSKQALKCHNCRATCHPECKSAVPLPCVPVGHTPNRSGITLAALAPTDPPRVPALIVHCINEIESRSKEVGLYRLSASEREVKELKEKFFKGKGAPILSNVDIHVMCAVVKDFLRNLDPLIPKLMWKDFIDAAGKTDQEDSLTALYQCLGQLPLPNRDTLAFLILHWQRVAEQPEFKMPVKNLAKILGPTVVGFSSLDLSANTMYKEQACQVQLMEKLLLIPTDYWNSFINKPEDQQLFRNILKPSDLVTPESFSRSTFLTKNATSEKNKTGTLPRRPVTRQQQRYFASPSLQH